MGTLTTISAGRLSAQIDATGAQLMSLTLDGGEYLWQGDERFWPRRAPVLFPIVGCLRGDHATSAQGDVSLKRHGIARLYDHAVVAQTPSSVTYELASSDETRAAYPFDFRLNKWQAQSAYSGMTGEELSALMWERLPEAFPHALEVIYPNVNPVDGMDVIYTINFVVYDGSNHSYTIQYKVVGQGQFEYVEGSLQPVA